MSPMQSFRRERVVRRRSPASNYSRSAVELSYCTEELGSESITISNACTTVPPPPPVLQIRAAHGLIEADNGENSRARSTFPESHLACLTHGDISYGNEPSSCLGRNTATLSSSSSSSSRISTHVRTFPPPISSLLSDRPLMRSFKANGRFVLQRVDSASMSPFRAIREDGRLRLELTSPNYWPPNQVIDAEDIEEKTEGGTKEVDVSEIKIEEAEEALLSSKGEQTRTLLFNYPMWVPRDMKLFSYWNTAPKCLPQLNFSIMSQKLNNTASACSSYAIISLRLGLILLLLEMSSVGGFKIKGVYYYNYRKLSDQGGKKRSMQHVVSNFTCVKEESLLLMPFHAGDGSNLVKTIDFRIAA